MPLELEINIDDHQLKAWSKDTGRKIPVFTLRGVKKSIALIERSVKKHLTGGNPLNVQTERLRSSIGHKIYKAGKKEVVGVIGTNVEYGAIHEFGLKKSETIKAHSRTITQAFGRAIPATVVSVRSHTRQMKMPKRPFMEPSLRENLKKITEILKEEMQKAIGR